MRSLGVGDSTARDGLVFGMATFGVGVLHGLLVSIGRALRSQAPIIGWVLGLLASFLILVVWLCGGAAGFLVARQTRQVRSGIQASVIAGVVGGAMMGILNVGVTALAPPSWRVFTYSGTWQPSLPVPAPVLFLATLIGFTAVDIAGGVVASLMARSLENTAMAGGTGGP